MKSFRRFLGLTRYYKKFIKSYELIAAPLMTLLRKYAFSWNEEAKTTFSTLKQVVAHPLVLKLLEFDKSFTKKCDACRVEIGAVLVQAVQPFLI